MNLHEAIIELQKLFPKQSISVSVDLWSSVYQGKRQPELQPKWRIFVADERNGSGDSASFSTENGGTLAATVEMAAQYVQRLKAPKETLDGARAAIENL